MDVIASQMRVYVIGFGCHIVQDIQGLLPHHGGANFQPRSSQDIYIYIDTLNLQSGVQKIEFLGVGRFSTEKHSLYCLALKHDTH